MKERPLKDQRESALEPQKAAAVRLLHHDADRSVVGSAMEAGHKPKPDAAEGGGLSKFWLKDVLDKGEAESALHLWFSDRSKLTGWL